MMFRRRFALCLALPKEKRSNVRSRFRIERVAGGSYILIHAADSVVLRQGNSELRLGADSFDPFGQSALVAAGLQADHVDAANVAAAAHDEPDQGALQRPAGAVSAEGDGVLRQKQSQSDGRMLADASAVAHIL